jgi:hypothetical protein
MDKNEAPLLQLTIAPPGANRRIFFAFARAVPNVIDRLIENDGSHNSVVVSLQYDDIMNHELRHCAKKTPEELAKTMVGVHETAYKMYASLLHPDDSPGPESVDAPEPEPESPPEPEPYPQAQATISLMGFDDSSKVGAALVAAKDNVADAIDILLVGEGLARVGIDIDEDVMMKVLESAKTVGAAIKLLKRREIADLGRRLKNTRGTRDFLEEIGEDTTSVDAEISGFLAEITTGIGG